MSSRCLTVQILLALAVLTAMNLIVQKLAVNSNPRQLMRLAEQSAPATDLFLGNSTMAAGLDEAAFVEANPGRRPLNMALGSSSPVEHFLLYRRQRKHAGATVYYGFLDSQLTDQPDGDWNTLVGNRAMAYYTDPEIAFGFYAADSWTKAIGLRLISSVPVLVERYTIWAKVEKLRRYLGEIGMPAKGTNRFGRSEDFSLLEANEQEFVKRCEQATVEIVPLAAPVTSIIRQAIELGCPIFMVEMPMPPGHRQRYYSSAEWKGYKAHLIAKITDAGGTYVDASDWIEEDGFADHLHLNPTGARLFSIRLGNWVAHAR